MEYPCNFVYEPLNNILSWTGVDGAEEYEIECRLVNSPIPDWNVIFLGSQTFVKSTLNPDTYMIRGKSRKTNDPHWSEYGPEEIVIISQAS